jgi:hypothetical protein
MPTSTTFLPSSAAPHHRRDRRLDRLVAQLHVARRLVAEQERNLREQAPEVRRARVLLAHQRQLVLHQRVIDDDDGGGHGAFYHVPNARGGGAAMFRLAGAGLGR